MSLVGDSSAALAWHFEDEWTESVPALLHRVVESGAVAPSLWRYEVADGLQVAVNHKRMEAAYRDRALANLAALNIACDAESETHAWSATVRLAERHGLTVYDAAYLELAQRRRLALATLDLILARGAKAEGIEVAP